MDQATVFEVDVDFDTTMEDGQFVRVYIPKEQMVSIDGTFKYGTTEGGAEDNDVNASGEDGTHYYVDIEEDCAGADNCGDDPE